MGFDIWKNEVGVQNHRDEIDRLISLEKGNATDKIIRLIGVPIGSVLLYLYTGDPYAFLWSFGYVFCYGFYRFFLNALGDFVPFYQERLTHLILMLLTLSFLWMPSLMFVDADRNMSLVGAALIGAQLMHLVHRGDTHLFVIFGFTSTVTGIMAVLLFMILPQISNVIAIIGIITSWIALVFYLAQSMLAARARILAESLAKQQSYEAQKLAALGQFAGGIAHDFNNILTAISGNLELYKLIEDEAEKEEVIAAAQQSSQRAAKIVNQILIYARKSPIELQRVNANTPLVEAGSFTQRLVPSNIKFSVIPFADTVFVRIDPDQMVTALMNLVLNSVDAIVAPGHVTLASDRIERSSETQISGDQVLPAGDYLVYSVADTGGGIKEDILNSVTDPFFTTKPVGKGTGLGLSMAVSIAQSVGGGLNIKPMPNGTMVQIYVPVAD